MVYTFYQNRFPLWAKILLTIFCSGSIVSRVFLFVDDCVSHKLDKNYLALVGAILACIGPLYIVFCIIDIICLCTSGEIKFLR